MDSTAIDIVQDDPGSHISSLCLRGNLSYSHACREIANLEREADEASKKLAEIFERLANAKSKANYIRSTMLAKLPNEILSMIFCAAWSAVDPSPRERGRFQCYVEPQEESRLSVALLVAGVCQKWRAIALSLPHIWADVRIFIHRQKGERALSVLRDILERSKRADLTIRLLSPPNGVIMHDQIQPALALLHKEVQRWRSLQVCASHAVIRDFFKPPVDLSGVHSLYVRSDIHRRPFTLFFPLWKKKNLRPQHVSFNKFVMANVTISWDRVTHVVANRFTVDQAMTVIRSAPLLTSLELIEPDEREEPQALYSPNFVHENLQRVTYAATERCASRGEKSIFSFNVFPALKIVDYRTSLSYDEDSFIEHLIQQKPPIRELKLSGSPYEWYHVLQALQAISPTLVRLDFWPNEQGWDESQYDEIFELLAAANSFPPPPPSNDGTDSNDDQEMFLPHLEYLSFSSLWPFAWDMIPFFFGLPSDPHRRPLKEFVFDGPDDVIPKEDLPALLDCWKAGFVVRTGDNRDLIQEALKFHSSTTTST
ncbi:hypothetical protein CPC08DRAFT_748525 [Agrocybe pediades]|nr:hypothetical protein CPC08DRAFT_748525 [Agrocybe pediades]